MMRIYMVDDEAPARARLATLLRDIANQCPHELVGEAGNPQDALAGISLARPDLVLLDVQMPGMTGIELAAHIAKLPQPPVIVFVTAYDQYALKAFDVDAVDYLLKPVRASRLAEALQRVSRLQALRVAGAGDALAGKRQHFSVTERGRVMLVPVQDVIYLKAELKYVTLHTRERSFLIEASLVSIEEEWASVFVRIHRNTLVARNAILGVERGAPANEPDAPGERPLESWEIILRDVSEHLPISRRQWPVVKALLR
jgi:two-component system, LytTR family, response regulator AlgR